MIRKLNGSGAFQEVQSACSNTRALP